MANEHPRILIVDDLAPCREKLREMLCDMGFSFIDEAGDGEEALKKLSLNKTSLILSDYLMTPLNGLDFLRKIKLDPILRDIPVLMVSSYGEEDVVTSALEMGASGFIHKPLAFGELRREVLRILCDQMEG